jgi:hypothetical protein
VILAGLLGGVLLFLAMFIFGWIADAIEPYSVLDLPGMRSVDDPIMAFFFAYPFMLSFMAAMVYGIARGSLQNYYPNPGLISGMILILLLTFPNLFLLFTSMEYPSGFYISQILEGIISFPLLGVL